jgi:hypothetical protein
MNHLYALLLFDSDSSSGSGVVFNLLLWGAMVLANWFLFEKAGEPGWKSLIPFYNLYTMFDIVYGNGLKCLLLLVPFLNIALVIMYCFRFVKAYGMHWAFGIGMLFVPQLITLIAAFGPFRYTGPEYKFI